MNGSKGFTLAELAIAVLILAVLLFGAMIPFSAQVDIRNGADTRRNMDAIKEAMLGFAQANGRLPCPANGATPAGTTDTATWGVPITAGAEQWDSVNNQCYVVFGVVPWATLGVPETDAWGRRLTYRVSAAFADAISKNTWQSMLSTNFSSNPPYLDGAGAWSQQNPPATPLTLVLASPANQNPTCPLSVGVPPPHTLTPAPTLSSFALCSLGDIAVFTRTQSGTAATPAGSALPAVFISHGKNGFGAWQSTGIRLPAPVAGSDEAANVSGTIQATPPGTYLQWAFYSRNPTPSAGGCSDPLPPGAGASPLCEFDDVVVTISSSALIARMVAAGRLP